MLAKSLLLVVCLSVAIENGVSQLPQNQMPISLFLIMRNKSATTEEVLENLAPEVLKNAKTIGSLPKRSKVTSRNSGSASAANILDLENQACAVRPYLYLLRQPDEKEHALNWPYSVQLPRCDGSCNTQMNTLYCTSVKSKNVSFYAYNVNYHQANATVVTPFLETVEIHEECDCRCTVSQAVCQKYNMSFSEDYCRCHCPEPIPTCPPKRQWNEKTCKCDCIGSVTDNGKLCHQRYHSRKFWDDSTCSCRCHDCRYQFLKPDPRTCSCTICTLKQSDCKSGKIADLKKCRCTRRRRG